jgi:hypothetical protein
LIDHDAPRGQAASQILLAYWRSFRLPESSNVSTNQVFRRLNGCFFQGELGLHLDFTGKNWPFYVDFT